MNIPAKRKRWLVRIAVGVVVLGLLAVLVPDCDELPESKPASAASAPAAQTGGDCSAFHYGGPLLGVAEPPLAPPPYAVRWTYKAQTPDGERAGIDAAAAVVGDTVYVADDKTTLHAIDLSTGKGKWKFSTQAGFATTPLVMGGNLYLGDMDGVFHAIGGDGKELWKFDTEAPIHASANTDGKYIYVGNDGAKIMCLDPAGNKPPVWSADAGDRVNSAPAVGNGMTFVSGCDAHLHGISLKDGSEKFAFDLGALTGGSPALLPDRLITGTDGGRVVCVSIDGTKQLWAYEDAEDPSMFYASPAVAEGVAVIGCRDRQIYAFDVNTGKILWKLKTRGDVDSSPVISGGRVYVGSKDKKLYVLDLKSGRSLWEFTASRSITATPAIARGVLIIGDSGGNVYCLEPQK